MVNKQKIQLRYNELANLWDTLTAGVQGAIMVVVGFAFLVGVAIGVKFF